MAGPDVFLGPTAEFPALMTGQLTSMRDNGTLTDFTITAQGNKTKLPCHKLVLAIHSPYLTAMFTTDMVEAANNTVHYNDFSSETMKLVLDYCYSEQIRFPSDQLIPIIIASDYLQIERLKKRCVTSVKSFLNPENVLSYLTFAVEKDLKDLEDIRPWCLEVIVKRFSDVSVQAAFLALTYDLLQECVKAVIPSDVKRDEVLRAVFNWVNDDVESRGKYLEELLLQIELNNCCLPAILDVMITYGAMIANCKVLDLLTQSVTKHTAQINESTDPAKDKTFLNPENVLQYLTFAGEHSLQDLKTWCLEIIVTSFYEVSNQAAFLALKYAELQDCMTEVVQSDVANDEVLIAVFKWVNENAESRIKHLEELLHQVPLDKCSFHVIHDVLETHETMIAANIKVFRLLIKAAKQQTVKYQATKKTLVIVGGQVGEQLNPTCLSLDTRTKKLSKLLRIPFDELSKGHIVCDTPTGFALTGGEGSDMCVLFVGSTMSWQIKHKMMRKRHAHGSIFHNGILYVLGGLVVDNKSASFDCLTLASGQWESLPDAPIVCFWPLLAELNGKLYMLEHQTTNKLHEFDVEKKEWKEKATLPGGSSNGASMIAVNGKLCVAGGYNNVCAWYTPTTNSWSLSEQRPCKEHHYGSLVQVDDNTVLLLGGSTLGESVNIEELNLVDGSWSVMEFKMPAKLYNHKVLFLDLPQQHE